MFASLLHAVFLKQRHKSENDTYQRADCKPAEKNTVAKWYSCACSVLQKHINDETRNTDVCMKWYQLNLYQMTKTGAVMEKMPQKSSHLWDALPTSVVLKQSPGSEQRKPTTCPVLQVLALRFHKPTKYLCIHVQIHTFWPLLSCSFILEQNVLCRFCDRRRTPHLSSTCCSDVFLDPGQTIEIGLIDFFSNWRPDAGQRSCPVYATIKENSGSVGQVETGYMC